MKMLAEKCIVGNFIRQMAQLLQKTNSEKEREEEEQQEEEQRDEREPMN